MSAARTLTVSGPALPASAAFEAVKLQGTEQIDTLFRYELTIKSPDALNYDPSVAANHALNESIGKEICVGIELADTGGGIREISGIIESASFLREEGRNVDARRKLTI